MARKRAVFLIGVAARSQHAGRCPYVGQQADIPSRTATAETRAKYGFTVGVPPLESCGRVGPAGLALLAELAEESCQRGTLQLGRAVGMPTRPLRAALEAAALRAQADAALLAAGAQVGRALGWLP